MNKYREQYKKDTKENADTIIYPSTITYTVFTNSYVEYLEQELSSAEAEIERLRKPYKYDSAMQAYSDMSFYGSRVDFRQGFDAARELSEQPEEQEFFTKNSKSWIDMPVGGLSEMKKVKFWTKEDIEYCEWVYDEFTDSYDSACGEKWQFVGGTPEDNHVKYCHGCGKPIKVKE